MNAAIQRGRREERKKIAEWVVSIRKMYPDPEGVFGLLLEHLAVGVKVPRSNSEMHRLGDRYRKRRSGL